MEVRSKIADQRIKVVEFGLIFGVGQFILVNLHQWVQCGDLGQEVLDLLLVTLELAKLLV